MITLAGIEISVLAVSLDMLSVTVIGLPTADETLTVPVADSPSFMDDGEIPKAR